MKSWFAFFQRFQGFDVVKHYAALGVGSQYKQFVCSKKDANTENFYDVVILPSQSSKDNCIIITAAGTVQVPLSGSNNF